MVVLVVCTYYTKVHNVIFALKFVQNASFINWYDLLYIADWLTKRRYIRKDTEAIFQSRFMYITIDVASIND